MKKILLVLQSTVIADEIQSRLNDRFDMVSCYTGPDVLEMLYWFRPDVLVIDLMVAGMDSISILRAVRDNQPSCRIMAVGSYFGDYAVEIMEKYHVSHAMRLPCDGGALAGRISDLALWEPETTDITREVQDLLATLGFKLNAESSRITALAICELQKNPNQNLTAGLYPAVACLGGTTATAVEKAIRSGIESAWKCCNKRIWQMYFGINHQGNPVKPSNKEFLGRMVKVIGQEKSRKSS